MFGKIASGAFMAGAAFVFAGCSQATGDNDAAQQGSASEAGYPAPRFLKSLVSPQKSELLAAARIAVRQTEGKSPLGKMQAGQTAHVILQWEQDMDVWNAIKQAWAERGVTAIGIPIEEATGLTRAQYDAWAKPNLQYGRDGWKELGVFEPQYVSYFPKEIQNSFGKPATLLFRGPLMKPYFDKHQEIEHVFSEVGGGKVFFGYSVGKENAKKMAGNFTYIDAVDLMQNAAMFPADVWGLIEDKIYKPSSYVSGGTFTDPEGTQLAWSMTRAQAERWKTYQTLGSNHMNLYPNPKDTTRLAGVIAGSANHVGFMPHMEVHLEGRGRVTKVVGGGKTGDLFRMLVNHPKFNAAKYPTAPQSGYWHLSADGFATNPKFVRNIIPLLKGSTDFANVSERERGGVIHFSFASWLGIAEDFDDATISAAIKSGERLGRFGLDPRDLEYAHRQKLPTRHTMHVHNYFGTAKWQLRDSGEWITISENGRVKAYQDPEVRALASKYGNPDDIFRYDWVPAIPGINVPGDYRTYANDPWKWISNEIAQIKDGTYRYLVQPYSVLRKA